MGIVYVATFVMLGSIAYMALDGWNRRRRLAIRLERFMPDESPLVPQWIKDQSAMAWLEQYKPTPRLAIRILFTTFAVSLVSSVLCFLAAVFIGVVEKI